MRIESMIESYDFAEHSAGEPLAQWLDGWKQLQREGWKVTVLLDEKRSHVVGLAWRPAVLGASRGEETG